MRIFGLTITREKAIPGASPVGSGSGGWWPLIRESFPGAWQRNIEIRVDSVLTYSAVFRCISLISSDVAKMRIRLVEKDRHGIWNEVENAAHSPVLRKPNRYQNRIQFFENWLQSKLIRGNTYVLKERDGRNVVSALHVLNPTLVTVLVAPDGSVYYELRSDHLAGVPDVTITVPASEIIHDRWNTIHHPLVGTSPIYACGLAAIQGLRIQEGSTKFFASGNRPGGVVEVPTDIPIEKAKELKQIWDEREPGTTAVLTNGMKYVPVSITASDAQLIEQLKWSAETVCGVFGVPAHMAGVGQPPTYNNIEALNSQYYTQCLQRHIEEVELALDEGLELPKPLGTEFDLDDLLRMDTTGKVLAVEKAIGSGGMAPNEARKRWLDLGPVEGGESPYMQQQNYSLKALAERDRDKPFAQPEPPPPAPPPAEPEPEEEEIEPDADDDDEARSAFAAEIIRRSLPHHDTRDAA